MIEQMMRFSTWFIFAQFKGGQTVGEISHLTILVLFKEGQTVYKIFKVSFFLVMRITKR